MKTDPIVAQVRRVRADIEAECGGDMHALYLKALEAQRKRAGPAGLPARTKATTAVAPSHAPRRRRVAA